MVTLHAPTPRLNLDGKRIAANSVVIALHVAAAMLLLAPISAPDPIADTRELVVVPDWTRPKPIDPPPLPPVEETIRQVTHATPTHVPVSTPPEASEVAYDDGTEVFVPDTGVVVPTDFGDSTAAPTIQALMTDRAPTPPYPALAQHRRISGKVMLLVLVDATGQPIQVDIEESSGSSLLDDAAQKFIRARWHFVPAQQNGVAISAYARVPVNFVL